MTQPLIIDTYAAYLDTGTKPGTIRLWVHRGELTHHGYDRRRRLLVDLDETRALTRRKAEATLNAAA